MSSVLYVHNVVKFLDKAAGIRGKQPVVTNLIRKQPVWVNDPESTIRLRTDTVGTLRRAVAVKARNELI